MKRILSTILAVGLLLGLGALAVLARGGGDILTPVKAAPVALAAAQPQTAAAPEAVPTPAPYMINEIALPLDVESTFGTVNFTAQGLAENTASGKATVSQVSHWNAGLQQSDTWDPNVGFGVYNGETTFDAWPLLTGQSYQLTLIQGASTVYSIVGDVPEQGDIQFEWEGGGDCQLNSFSVPLDQESSVSGKDLGDAQKLAEDIGVPGVSQVTQWNATYQQDDTWDPVAKFGIYNGETVFEGEEWAVQIGYPYWICALTSLDGQTWP